MVLLRKLIGLFLSISLLSCNDKASTTQSEIHKPNSTETDKIFETFEQWKKKVLSDSTYLLECPSVEDFETMGESARAEKLSQAHILPENYIVSFGDYNGDKKIDAIYSFPDYICYSNYVGHAPTNSYNRTGSFVLVTSTFDSYKNSSNEIEVEKIEKAIQKKFRASRVSVSLEKIDGEFLVSGTCKIWLDLNNKNFLGDCCPNYLLKVTINNGQREISTYINDDESEGYDIHF